MIIGAITACTLSTSPRSKNAPRMTPPPSTSSERTSRSASSRRSAPRSTCSPSSGKDSTSAPVAGGAEEDRIDPRPQLVRPLAGGGAGDLARVAGGAGDAAIQGGGELGDDER